MAAISQPTLSQQAHQAAMTTALPEVAATLQTLLTRPLLAYAVGVSPKTIGRWATGETKGIPPEGERRLRATYQAVTLLGHRYAPETIRAWFIGLNPDLGDRAPVEALHAGELREVLGAAVHFLATS